MFVNQQEHFFDIAQSESAKSGCEKAAIRSTDHMEAKIRSNFSRVGNNFRYLF